ncbi:MAG: hypothetical protein ACREOO_31490 [bacterium]
MVYEAIALGYLSDAFSAGHMLLPASDDFSVLLHVNSKQAHKFYGNEGVFVINSRGEVWRTFGDKLMRWYAFNYRPVHEACKSSLRELFLVFYVSVGSDTLPKSLKKWWQSIEPSRPPETILQVTTESHGGVTYYTSGQVQLPTLQLLPMPVTATWSIRKDALDTNGFYIREHFPQLRGAGLHDPNDKDIDKAFLYSSAAVPGSMIPLLLFSQSKQDSTKSTTDFISNLEVQNLIKSHPHFASVHYVQERNFPPSYVGPLFSLGRGMPINASDGRSGTVVGMGYGFCDDFLVLRKVSFEAPFMYSYGHAGGLLLAPTFGMGIGLSWKFALHSEAGYAWGLRAP